VADTLFGLDLGQLSDFSAIAVVKRSLAIDENGLPITTALGYRESQFDVLALRRYPLRTPYTDIVMHVVAQVSRRELGPFPRLVLDATGCGRPVADMFRAALDPADVEIHAVTITGGRDWERRGWEWRVAKVELVGALRAALESRRIKVARGVANADALKRDLLDFRVKLTAAANETYAANEGTHDDLVTALALPIWLARQPAFEMSTDGNLEPREIAALTAERRERERADLHAIERANADDQAQFERLRDRDRIAQDRIDDDRWWEPGG
jgi:hypothetical protein